MKKAFLLSSAGSGWRQSREMRQCVPGFPPTHDSSRHRWAHHQRSVPGYPSIAAPRSSLSPVASMDSDTSHTATPWSKAWEERTVCYEGPCTTAEVFQWSSDHAEDGLIVTNDVPSYCVYSLRDDLVSSSNLLSLKTCHVILQIILVVIFSHHEHAMLSVRLSRGLSSVTEYMPCCLSDYPGGYLQSLKTCHVVHQIIPGDIFSHWGHAMLSIRLSWGLSSVTEDMPCYPLHFAGDDLLSLMTYQFPSELTSILSP